MNSREIIVLDNGNFKCPHCGMHSNLNTAVELCEANCWNKIQKTKDGRGIHNAHD